MRGSHAPESHYVATDEGRIHYTRSGHGAPLLLLHSNGSSSRYWEPLVPRFAAHFTCYNIDSPGWGKSDVPARQWSVDELANSIMHVMSAARLERASICATHAGALLALNFAARFAERIDRLILDGLPFYDAATGAAFYARKIQPHMTDTESFDRAVYPRFTWEQARNRDPASYASGVGMSQEEWERGQELRDRRRYWQRLSYDSILTYDVTGLVSALRSPVLLTVGSGDLLYEFAEPAHKAIAGSRLLVMPTTDGTSAPTGAPDQFVAAALAFLQPDASS